MIPKNFVIQKQKIAEYFTSLINQKQLINALPRVGLTPERIIRLVFSAINQVPKLAECTPQSLFNAMIQVAQLGLEPNTVLGHAYLVPYKDNKQNIMRVQLIIGYKGYLSLCRRSGELFSISSHVVYKGDEFKFQYGTEEFITHVTNLDIYHDNKDIIYAYAVAKLKNGSTSFEIMSKSQIEGIRNRSKSPNFGPWITDYEPMCRKTVIRRLMNYLPLSTELAQAIQYDGQNESGIQDISDLFDIPTIEEKPSTLQKMAQKSQETKNKSSKIMDLNLSLNQQKIADLANGNIDLLILAIGNLVDKNEIEAFVFDVIGSEDTIKGLKDSECIKIIQEVEKVKK